MRGGGVGGIRLGTTHGSARKSLGIDKKGSKERKESKSVPTQDQHQRDTATDPLSAPQESSGRRRGGGGDAVRWQWRRRDGSVRTTWGTAAGMAQRRHRAGGADVAGTNSRKCLYCDFT